MTDIGSPACKTHLQTSEDFTGPSESPSTLIGCHCSRPTSFRYIRACRQNLARRPEEGQRVGIRPRIPAQPTAGYRHGTPSALAVCRWPRPAERRWTEPVESGLEPLVRERSFQPVELLVRGRHEQ